jgi:hypothetical protein
MVVPPRIGLQGRPGQRFGGPWRGLQSVGPAEPGPPLLSRSPRRAYRPSRRPGRHRHAGGLVAPLPATTTRSPPAPRSWAGGMALPATTTWSCRRAGGGNPASDDHAVIPPRSWAGGRAPPETTTWSCRRRCGSGSERDHQIMPPRVYGNVYDEQVLAGGVARPATTTWSCRRRCGSRSEREYSRVPPPPRGPPLGYTAYVRGRIDRVRQTRAGTAGRRPAARPAGACSGGCSRTRGTGTATPAPAGRANAQRP